MTGGGSGIGAMFAAAYVQNGARVYIASRKEKQLKEVRAQPQDVDCCLQVFRRRSRCSTKSRCVLDALHDSPTR